MFVEIICSILFVVNFVHSTEVSIFPTLPITVTTSQNDLCAEHSMQFLKNLENFTLWAYEMRDASAQSASSVLRGSKYSLGNSNQCITSKAPFPTQFCLSEITANIPNLKTPQHPFSMLFDGNENVLNRLFRYKNENMHSRNVMNFGWCIPASCEPKVIQDSLNKYLDTVNSTLKEENVTFTAKVPPIFCQSSDKKKGLDVADIVFLVLVGMLLILAGIATYLVNKEEEASSKKNCSLARKLFTAFALQNNFNDLSKESGEKSLKVLHGLKALSMCVVVMGHRSAMYSTTPLISVEPVEKTYQSIWISWILRLDFFVDTFFFLSGLLVCYLLLGQIEANQYKPALFIIVRYLRLSPVYAFVIFYQATLLYHTGDGALWEAVVGRERQECRNGWWTNLLYVSNLVNSEQACMIQSWYLACDFQYFLVALILIYILYKNKYVGFCCVGICLSANIITMFSLTYIYKRPGLLRFVASMLSNAKVDFDFNFTYIKPYTRAGPYCLGIIAGYIYYKKKGTDYKITQMRSNILIFTSIAIQIGLLFSMIPFYDPHHKYNAIESALYGSLDRVLWSLGIFCFIYAVDFGPIGFVYKFFSWYIFVPIAKLSYGGYLWQMGFQLRDVGSATGLIKYDHFNIFLVGTLDVVMSYLLSFVTYLLIEQPTRKIIQALLYRTKVNPSLDNKQVTLKKVTLNMQENKV